MLAVSQTSHVKGGQEDAISYANKFLVIVMEVGFFRILYDNHKVTKVQKVFKAAKARCKLQKNKKKGWKNIAPTKEYYQH
ncbi:hypothetical protein Hanom_Chr12g01132291 [Helianthus anomalus]